MVQGASKPKHFQIWGHDIWYVVGEGIPKLWLFEEWFVVRFLGSIYLQIFGNVSDAGPKLLEEQVLTQLRVDLHIFQPAELCAYAKSVKFGFKMLVKLSIGSSIIDPPSPKYSDSITFKWISMFSSWRAVQYALQAYCGGSLSHLDCPALNAANVFSEAPGPGCMGWSILMATLLPTPFPPDWGLDGLACEPAVKLPLCCLTNAS